MKKLICSDLILILLLIGALEAQPVRNEFQASAVGHIKNDISVDTKILFYSVDSTATAVKQNIKTVIFSVAFLSLVSMSDVETNQFFRNNQSENTKKFCNNVNKLGKSKNVAIGYISLYTSGWILQQPAIRHTAMELLSAYGISGLMTTAIKELTGRARPYKEKDQYYFLGLNGSGETYRSFPSGHATISFSGAAVLAEHTDNRWLKGGLYATAGMVSTARMYKNQHWFSDVLAGAAVGYITGKIVSNVSAGLLNRKNINIPYGN